MGLNQLSVSPYWQPTVTGLVILVAVALDQYNRLRNNSSAAPTRPDAIPADGKRSDAAASASE